MNAFGRLIAPNQGSIAVFEAGTALLIGERWVRWHYLEHRSFDDPQAVSTGLARGLKQLERLVHGTAVAGEMWSQRRVFPETNR